MQVHDIKILTAEKYCQLQARVESPVLDEPFLLWYRFSEAFAESLRVESGDPFVAALLLPAMCAGESLEIPAPVSPRLLGSLEDIQAIYRCWDPRLSPVAIKAPLADQCRPEMCHSQQVGLFFSLGVDSFY